MNIIVQHSGGRCVNAAVAHNEAYILSHGRRPARTTRQTPLAAGVCYEAWSTTRVKEQREAKSFYQ